MQITLCVLFVIFSSHERKYERVAAVDTAQLVPYKHMQYLQQEVLPDRAADAAVLHSNHRTLFAKSSDILIHPTPQ